MSNKIDNFKGKKGGKPRQTSALTEMAKRFIDGVYVEGMPIPNAYKDAGYKSPYTKKRADAVMALPAAQTYIARLNNDDNLKKKASKSFLIKTLMDRLEHAKDADLVSIVKVINSMMGYTSGDGDIKVDNKIEIIWKPLLNFEGENNE